MRICQTFSKLNLLLVLLLTPFISQADVVKPALIEISAYTDGRVVVDIRASLEALLTGINSRYKNTKDAPNAEEYDVYRKMSATDLRREFTAFEPRLLQTIRLYVDGELIPLSIKQIQIPEPGYTKIPRISTILLQAAIDTDSKTLRWYYPEAFGDNAVRVRQVDEANQRWHWSQWQWLRNDESSEQFTLDELFHTRPVSQTIYSYVTYGYEHILPKGLDHILFIIGLYLLSTRFKPLLWQVTMFTLAHTITLGLSINGIVELPARIVEPLIALSIAYVGFENIVANLRHKAEAELHKSRLFLVFGFGLLHGLGFASVLQDFGMPEDAFITALISFNVGVELGQLSVLLLAFALIGFWFGKKPYYNFRVVVPASAAITITGLLWTLERLTA
jgi:hydrogenase/urease accessory protein HupE